MIFSHPWHRQDAPLCNQHLQGWEDHQHSGSHGNSEQGMLGAFISLPLRVRDVLGDGGLEVRQGEGTKEDEGPVFHGDV